MRTESVEVKRIHWETEPLSGMKVAPKRRRSVAAEIDLEGGAAVALRRKARRGIDEEGRALVVGLRDGGVRGRALGDPGRGHLDTYQDGAWIRWAMKQET